MAITQVEVEREVVLIVIVDSQTSPDPIIRIISIDPLVVPLIQEAVGLHIVRVQAEVVLLQEAVVIIDN